MCPIKGLTEQRRMPRQGKIHLGIMVENANHVKYPKAVDYFVLPQGEAIGAEYYGELVAAFGEQPRELRIVFPLEDEDKIASQYYRSYSKSRGLICKGDGEVCTRMVDKNTGNLADRDTQEAVMKEMPCAGRECVDYQARACQEVMNLQFMLPEISGLGVWQIDTGSINSIRNINSNLELLRTIYGRVSMIPLLLSMEQRTVTPPDDPKRRTKTVWVLNIKHTDSLMQAAINAQRKPMALVAGLPEDDVLLPTSDDERPELITYDWEGVAGEPIPPEERMTQAEIASVTDALWGEGTAENLGMETGGNLEVTVEGVVKKSHQEGDVRVIEDFEIKSIGVGEPPAKEITYIGEKEHLPMGEYEGQELTIVETGQVIVWHQVDAVSGRWLGKAVGEPIDTPVAEKPPTPTTATQDDEVPDEDVPADKQAFLQWVSSHGKKYGPTWFYNAFKVMPIDLDDATSRASIYERIKALMSW